MSKDWTPIFIDSREGSKELLSSIPNGILVELDYGDAMFDGNGPEGRIQVGVERKRIGDLVNSIMTGRLSGHQLPGMLEEYQRNYLIVEGLWRAHPISGEVETFKGGRWRKLERGKRKIKARDVYAYLTGIEEAGISWRETTGLRATALMVMWLYGWWNKRWEDHSGHLVLYKPPPPTALLRAGKPSLLLRWAVELPGVGWKRVKPVEKYFKTSRRMANSTEEEWLEIEGIGKVTAREVVRIMNEGG